ncbi:MAG: site-specific DNA-methyltransferase, partial [Candidatus Huberarchaeum crystalense]
PFNTGSDFDYVDRFQDSSWLSLMNDRLAIAKNLLENDGSFYLHLDYRANHFGKLIAEYVFNKDNFINEIIWYYKDASGVAKKGFRKKHDNIYLFAKSESYFFNADEIRTEYSESTKRQAENKTISYGRETTLNEKGKYPDDVLEIAIINSQSKERFDFNTQKPEKLLERIIKVSSNIKTIIMDYHLGSGTTTATAHKLGRRWLGVEMGEHFYTVVLPRMKKVLSYDKSGISKEVKEYQGGGFFKYYELEQYEDALKNCKYGTSDLFSKTSDKVYQDYVFMKDEKMLSALEIDYKNKKVKVDLNKLYPDIDIAETLSNLTGKWIKAIKDG